MLNKARVYASDAARNQENFRRIGEVGLTRGDRRVAIYRDEQGREDGLGVFGDVRARFNWRCREMTNHYHFVPPGTCADCRVLDQT